MKRSVAVLGETPAFLRWAIEQDCGLRDLDVENLADATFRQLRTVRELSLGIEERRVLKGYCLSRDCADAEVRPEDVLGFPAQEVFDVFGDANEISALCSQCPANCFTDQRGVGRHSDAFDDQSQISAAWAGCFGWLPTDLNYSFDPSLRLEPTTGNDLVRLINEGAQRAGFSLSGAARNAQPFYALWQTPWLDGGRLDLTRQVFSDAAMQVGHHQALTNFAVACQIAYERQLRLFVELVPPGVSDGLHWRRNGACSRCGCDGQQRGAKRVCPGCGTDAPIGHFRKSKVLGRRPYLTLVKILSVENVVDLQQKFRDQNREPRQ